MKPLTSVRLFKKILILEVIGVLGVYTLYYKMNSSEDFRHKMKRRCPSVLEVYYKSNEWAGIYGLKELDEEKWLTKKP
ncbi:protein CEBPZOS [Pantherophis guttatus]|uniref:Protein CEBPZOS n=1 Tax=Pantherophis guttatus TaxID=94885 RepID=A0A6P9CI51_PANGU|nr:protein CEBPZOS [Pantherophis guttatus]